MSKPNGPWPHAAWAGVVWANPVWPGAAESGTGSFPPPAVAPYRDRDYLRFCRDLLELTDEFGLVTTSGLPESDGQSAEVQKLASLELKGYREDHLGSDYNAQPLLRSVEFLLTIHVRDPDPDARDDELDRLAQVAGNALVGKPLGGESLAPFTQLGRGVYEAAQGPERRLRVLGTFVYEISDWGTRDTTP
jgi:hypothetical protein